MDKAAHHGWPVELRTSESALQNLDVSNIMNVWSQIDVYLAEGIL